MRHDNFIVVCGSNDMTRWLCCQPHYGPVTLLPGLVNGIALCVCAVVSSDTLTRFVRPPAPPPDPPPCIQSTRNYWFWDDNVFMVRLQTSQTAGYFNATSMHSVLGC